MNKYELALVVTAKIDDNARAEVVEKAKGYITRANGVIEESRSGARRDLLTRFSISVRATITLSTSRLNRLFRLLSKEIFESWTTYFVIL